VDFFDIIDVK